jgi:hypothetical protein
MWWTSWVPSRLARTIQSASVSLIKQPNTISSTTADGYSLTPTYETPGTTEIVTLGEVARLLFGPTSMTPFCLSLRYCTSQWLRGQTRRCMFKRHTCEPHLDLWFSRRWLWRGWSCGLRRQADRRHPIVAQHGRYQRHHMQHQDNGTSSTTGNYMAYITRSATESQLYPRNIDRQGSFCLSVSWQTFTSYEKECRRSPSWVCDVVLQPVWALLTVRAWAWAFIISMLLVDLASLGIHLGL